MEAIRTDHVVGVDCCYSGTYIRLDLNDKTDYYLNGYNTAFFQNIEITLQNEHAACSMHYARVGAACFGQKTHTGR